MPTGAVFHSFAYLVRLLAHAYHIDQFDVIFHYTLERERGFSY